MSITLLRQNINNVHYAITPNIIAQYDITPEKGLLRHYATVHYAITPPK